ncbi:hypothetical protein J2Y74_002790 [Pseudomonas migulae]|uniref:hypothetical protein n=1 Tax=Pseudomonas migulae TaxID=78543 RepID=UPI00209D42C8|nr:hypothetical protein [Pseudomonas migulae]MCP1518480.1 hypothetical protein [Pseudomonas migulae]
MFNFGFLMKSSDEIAGLYTPGKKPAIYGTSESLITPEISSAHERAHRDLCEATSLGQYLKFLAILSSRTNKKDIAKTAESALSSAISHCWIVQEGYATSAQVLRSMVMGREDLIDTATYLSPSYNQAFSQFLIPPDVLDEYMTSIQIYKQDSAYALMAAAFLSACPETLALAAMSIPMKSITAENDLLSYEMECHVRKHAPDVRLPIILANTSKKFMFHCAFEQMRAAKKSQQQGNNEAVAECRTELARHLCHIAGLQFEPLECFNLQRALEQYQCEGDGLVDVRDYPWAEIEEYLSDQHFLGGASLLFELSPLRFTLAKNVYADVVEFFQITEPHLICEVCSLDTDANRFLVYLHVYITKASFLEFVGSGEKVGVTEETIEIYRMMEPETAIQFALFVLEVGGAELAELTKCFSHSSWKWVFGEPGFVSDICSGWGRELVADANDVFLYKFDVDLENCTLPIAAAQAMPSPPVGQVFCAGVEDGVIVEGHVRHASASDRVLAGFPNDLALLLYRPIKKYKKVRAARIALHSHVPQGGKIETSFTHSCIAITFFQGLHSSLQANHFSSPGSRYED